jgi:uncharacterized protein YndB with AHSA1/START domain
MKAKQNLSTELSILINAGSAVIWKVLTDTEMIKQYLFGSNVVTDWKVGSIITFTRITNETEYQDKGEILEIEPKKRLTYSYWSSQEGYPDIPENYLLVSYTIEKEDARLRLTYRREKIPIEFEQKNQEKYLPGMLGNLKKLAEEVDDKSGNL